jgi:signal transduction histidine kinase
MSLKRALLMLVVMVLAVGTIPAGIVAHGRLARALEERVGESLSMAPDLLATRWTATVDVRMMHARDVARTPGLAEALQVGDERGAIRMVEQAGASFPEAPILVGPDGEALISAELLDATRRGEMPVEAVSGPEAVRVVSLAPIEMGEEWVGAVGGISVLDDAEAVTLAGLTRSEVLILDGEGGVVGSSVSPEEADLLAAGLRESSVSGPVGGPAETGAGEVGLTGGPPPRAREIRVGSVPYLVLSTSLSPTSRVVFIKDLQRELAVLPLLRRIALWSVGITLALALILGSVFAGRLARPVRGLADAADRLAAGDFDAPLLASGVSEVTRVSEAFGQMRAALRARVVDLEEANRRQEEANRELEDRQERLLVLQAELVQRDRLASAGRLLSQLAHEIRNPIAGIRNCLEVLRRRATKDPEAQEFADLAIDELLRMHELTEQSEVTRVAREVAALLRAGTRPGTELNVSVVGPPGTLARMAPDSLKQVLLNLGLNAREAMEDEGPIEIIVASGDDTVTVEVLDRGPGIEEEILPRIFDPFFTTKAQVQGVGLGLFTSEALVRTYGGRIQAANRTDGPGARFTVQLPEGTPGTGVSPEGDPDEASDHD